MRNALPLAVALTFAGTATTSEPHWSHVPIRRPALPPLREGAQAASPIDRFVLARLHEHGLDPAPPASRNVLIRRLCFDLLGLPPSPVQIEEFVADRRPDAYERLVDRLLASPHYGERWARHWLDAAGYVDVVGVDNDAGTVKLGENKWLYRDHVIRSFNADKPLAPFLTEQLAGDELVDWRSAREFTLEARDSLIATGFLRIAADDTDENELNTLDIRHGVLQRTAETVATHLLAVTFQCAKCHDHKYEPISQRDYFRWLAIFQPVFDPGNWMQPKQRQLADQPPRIRELLERINAEIDREIAACRERKKKEPKSAADLDRQIAILERQKRSWGHWQTTYETGSPTPTRILWRGQHDAPGEAVEPAFPAFLSGDGKLDPKPSPYSSGRRTALARRLTDWSSAAGGLVVRVQVNRIWRRLFGRGLVEPVDNLGVTGGAPTHPQLLEWLAAEFVAVDGRLKLFLRQLVLSNTYRQASAATHDVAERVDPENTFLWKQRLRRLESEAVRDALLCASGNLQRGMFGPPAPVAARPDGSFVPSGGRRGIYLVARRNYHPTLLNVFDQPTIATNCLARVSSAVVLQSLTMLNDPFVREQAEALARRIGNERDPIAAAYLTVLSRKPSDDETQWCAILMQRHAASGRPAALSRLCHMLLNASEFLYIP